MMKKKKKKKLNDSLDDFTCRTKAGRANPANHDHTYYELALISTEKIMNLAGRYAASHKQTKENLIHLKDGIVVGEWRDSMYGMHIFHRNSESLTCVYLKSLLTRLTSFPYPNPHS